MRINILSLIFCLLPILAFSQSSNAVKNDSVTLKVFIPDFRQKNYDYLEMLLTSFKYYFHEGLAFENKKDCRVKIEISVKGDTSYKLTSFKLEKTIPSYFDKNNNFYELKGFSKPKPHNDDATIILLNAQNEIKYVDSTYRAQGEHLKILESKIKNALAIKPPLSKIGFSPLLKIGDFAPDVHLGMNRKLSDLKGLVVVLSFYPAAFSGNKTPSNPTHITCVGQISSLATIQPFYNFKNISSRGYETYAITSSTDALIQLWRVWMATSNIHFINDTDYSISKSFNSYNNNGYNNRYTYIIGKDGKIAYINPSFYFGEEVQIQSIIVKERSKH